MSKTQRLCGNIVNVIQGTITAGTVTIRDGIIHAIEETPDATYDTYLCPGLVDAHVHVESSLLSPSEFGRAALIHGTIASISDPHEIANVLGIPGVEWMLEDAKRTPFHIHFGAPSCVPATPFETAGARFGPDEIDRLLSKPEIGYLAEVMNFPAVITRDPEMMAIIETAKRHGKRIDGHAPALIGKALRDYATAGIETDHESITLEEARQKCQLGMKIAIREGSAARNFEALWPLLNEFPEQCFLCSDDKHPDDLVVSHINALVARAIRLGVDPLSALRAATLNPIRHYGLKVGCLQVGDSADLAEFDSLTDMRCLRSWKSGQLVAANGTSTLSHKAVTPINRFDAHAKQPTDFQLPPTEGTRRIIVALDGQIITEETEADAQTACPEQDLCYIAVVNRYADTPPAVALIKGFGLRDAAIASSVAHDSHNIVVVGSSPELLCKATNLIIHNKGGLSFASEAIEETLPLPIAGLMSGGSYKEVAQAFTTLSRTAKQHGSSLESPYMALSFMALLVIPKLKISDKGLFDVSTFSLI
ncbi:MULTISPECIES: adenine deaminase [unclassified Lentimonas]|uniref:adenine deaminase n=1 Tax=unclassified Lentimonas TaxID=2630993 RepID=UPI00132BE660|nr:MULTISPECIES: adenine deaminase [unclassified Lentimonas]CAA6692327.1 Adenine deaminase (EC [Lentimonas sp. CC10]CAA6694661.1 Adenine deaminase (EC [Lentimonas sp. CC19]CAA7071410.1 Adenine deaminase (EC [Lentimonas sp. CC11]